MGDISVVCHPRNVENTAQREAVEGFLRKISEQQCEVVRIDKQVNRSGSVTFKVHQKSLLERVCEWIRWQISSRVADFLERILFSAKEKQIAETNQNVEELLAFVGVKAKTSLLLKENRFPNNEVFRFLSSKVEYVGDQNLEKQQGAEGTCQEERCRLWRKKAEAKPASAKKVLTELKQLASNEDSEVSKNALCALKALAKHEIFLLRKQATECLCEFSQEESGIKALKELAAEIPPYFYRDFSDVVCTCCRDKVGEIFGVQNERDGFKRMVNSFNVRAIESLLVNLKEQGNRLQQAIKNGNAAMLHCKNEFRIYFYHWISLFKEVEKIEGIQIGNELQTLKNFIEKESVKFIPAILEGEKIITNKIEIPKVTQAITALNFLSTFWLDMQRPKIDVLILFGETIPKPKENSGFNGYNDPLFATIKSKFSFDEELDVDKCLKYLLINLPTNSSDIYRNITVKNQRFLMPEGLGNGHSKKSSIEIAKSEQDDSVLQIIAKHEGPFNLIQDTVDNRPIHCDLDHSSIKWEIRLSWSPKWINEAEGNSGHKVESIKRSYSYKPVFVKGCDDMREQELQVFNNWYYCSQNQQHTS